MDSLAETALNAKAYAVAAWFLIFFAAERLHPADRLAAAGSFAPPALRRLARNAVLFLANVAFSPLVVVPVTAFAAAVHPPWRPAWWQGGPGLALDLLLLDFLIYWWHRANHEIPFLWRFHSVHHLDATLDTTTALRFHFGEVLLSAFARASVILLIGFPLATVLVFEALVLIAAIFHHSNLAIPAAFERALSRIFITPSIHWVHHHARRIDTDANYGTIFSFWDPLFRSRSRSRREPGMDIGVEGKAEEPLFELILHPAFTA